MGDFKGSIMEFFGLKPTKRPLTTFDRRHDDYYSHIYVNRAITVGVRLIAEVDQKSRKAVTQSIMEEGISKRSGELIHEQNELTAVARAAGVRPKRTRFSVAMHRLAREKGADISKFI